MMPPEIRDMSAAVAQHFGWWKPGQMIPVAVAKQVNEYTSVMGIEDREIPPPDLTQPQWFVRLLKQVDFDTPVFDEESKTVVDIPDRYQTELWFGHDSVRGGEKWHCRLFSWQETYDADTPELALLKAAYELVKK